MIILNLQDKILPIGELRHVKKIIGIVNILQLSGGSHKTVHVDGGPLSEENTARIEKEHFSVCVERAVNLGHVISRHTVQSDAVCIWLCEIDCLVRCNIEARPVNRNTIGCLIDIHRVVHDGTYCSLT